MVLTRLLLPAVRRARGLFVFVNSSAGLTASADWSAYAASKFGLRAFADSLRAEEVEHGVRVSTVFPSRTATPMHRLAARIAERPAAEWRARLEAAGVPTGEVKTVLEALREVEASPLTGVAPSVPGDRAAPAAAARRAPRRLVRARGGGVRRGVSGTPGGPGERPRYLVKPLSSLPRTHTTTVKAARPVDRADRGLCSPP